MSRAIRLSIICLLLATVSLMLLTMTQVTFQLPPVHSFTSSTKAAFIEDPLPDPFISLINSLTSQAGQDIYLFDTLFRKSPHMNTGFFIEFGARDGVLHSNSFFYEKNLGWKGILAEALQKEQGNIAKNRSNSAVIDGGICEKPGKVTFMDSGIGGWGGIDDSYDHARLNHVTPMAQMLSIACFTLTELLDKFGVKHVFCFNQG
jgi:hypothetical protein